MDEVFVVLLVALFLALLAATPILLIFVLVRASGLRKRVDGLEGELRALRETLPGLAGRAQAPAGGPFAAPAEARVEPVAPLPAAPAVPVVPVAPRIPAAPVVPVAPLAPVQPPAPERVTPAPPKKRINWEQWAGVRGAAVLGGAVLALAAILFVKLAFENQWIGPQARCWLGAGFGVLAIGAGALLRRRAYRFLPNALDGAGVVALFAATWAAHRVYGFLSLAAALPLLAVVTALACALALRHRSQLTAVLGLAGGFTTAFLLSERGDQPLGLFGYLLVLDLGLLFVGRRSGWPLLGALALLGTFFYESLYALRDLDPEKFLLGLGVLGAFALVFAFGARPAKSAGAARGAARAWFASQVGAVLLPLALALHFAGRSDFQGEIHSLAGLLFLLCAAACVLARAQKAPWLAVGAAVGAIAVVGLWALDTEAASQSPFTLAALLAGIALFHHAFFERDQRLGESARGAAAAMAASGALLFALVTPVPSGETSTWAWTLALGLPAAALVRQAAGGARRSALPLVAGGLAGFGAALHEFLEVPVEPGPALPPPVAVSLAFLTLGGLGLHAAATLYSGRARSCTLHAAGLFLVPGLIGLVRVAIEAEHDSTGFLFALLAPVALLALAAGREASVLWTAAGPLAFALLMLGVSINHDFEGRAAFPAAIFATLAGAGLLFGAAPLFFEAARAKRILWAPAALALPILYPLIHAHYVERFSNRAAATPLVAAAFLSGGLALVAVRRLALAPALRPARSWYTAVAVLFAAAALPVQLDFEWPWVFLALGALGLALLARRFASSGLGHVAVGFGLASAAGLAGAAMTPFHYEREGTPVLSWIGYAHGVPLLVLLAAAALLRERKSRHLAAAIGLAAVVVGFLLVNVTILDVFSAPETRLAFGGSRHQTRDLSTSIAWAVYALVLLGAGTGLRASALRWTSLVLFLATIAKVFLFDLGELEGLNRVASLGGLAIALLTVSLLYQRFVFRRTPLTAGE
jgi:uncharacterized membrane protein